LFFVLRRDHETHQKCRLLMEAADGMYVLAESVNGKGKKKGCCKGGEKKCIEDSGEAEDVQMLTLKGDPVNVERRAERGRYSSDGSDDGDSKENFSPVSGRTRGQRPIIQAPLRQAIGMEGQPVFVHVPFTTSDLLNWKQSVGSYWENAEGMHQLLETIMLTHNPNWGDIQAMLNTFFTMEERRMVLGKAKEEGERKNVNARVDEYMPKTEPDWDPN
ncbi:hypothetical protein FQV07_0010168, partial [Pygoscelis papua]